MAISSPREVDPAELYDGPEPGGDNIEHLYGGAPGTVQYVPPVPPPRMSVRQSPHYAATLTAALDILGARLLALIAVLAACLIWGWAVYSPEPDRTYAALAFSLSVFIPAVALYWRRG